ncbi:hypothetical protein [Acaryochloris thomasi]|uniref:hypothetical protein n=1 Tax=Acaryochloris thomasi TaxID=2929456 RepID=UPI000DA64757|nr:hypothetical protein [Acaryochloris thomasi]
MKCHLQLSLLAEPLDPLQKRIDAALLQSLHSYSEADERWSQWRERELSFWGHQPALPQPKEQTQTRYIRS